MARPRALALSVLLVTLCWAAPDARAAGDYQRGPNAVGVRIGGQGSWADWTPGGFKLNLFWDHKLRGRTWSNVQLNVVAGSGGGTCVERCEAGGCWWDCGGGWNGRALEIVGGFKWKFKPGSIDLVLYPKAGVAINFINFPGDWFGVGLAFRGGGGLAYYFTRWFGASLEMNLNLGFSWIDHDHYEYGGFEFLWSFDFLVGVEFLF